MLAVFVHVGQTPNISPYGKKPIFSNGTFKFVKIFVDNPRLPLDPTYEELKLGDWVPLENRILSAYNSPEFETLTYNHVTRPGQGHVYERLRSEGGFMFFFSTLFFHGNEAPIMPEISSNRGAFIIGYFKTEGIYTTDEIEESGKLQDRFKANGGLGQVDENGKQVPIDLWICGSKGQLLPKAVPLTSPSNYLQWNQFSKDCLTTSGVKSLGNYSRAFYNWTLVCPEKNFARLQEWIYRFSGIDFLK